MECEIAFNKLKDLLVTYPIIRFPDWSRLFVIKTDASSYGIGAVLLQLYEVDQSIQLFPVCYSSWSLKAAERNYSVTDKEGLALVWAVKKYKVYLEGSHFKVITDHSALKALMQKENLEGRLLR